ncbi:MAG TPA: hypothetical protein VII06_43185 [Chloroflexota bacterium]|jgi:hypothetical protein
MTAAAIVRIPAPSGGARPAVDTALGAVPLVVLSGRMAAPLTRECGSTEKLVSWLLKTVPRRRRPIGLHDAEAGRTFFSAPPDWPGERLAGYVAVHHAELEQMLGPIRCIRAGGEAAC